MRLPSFPVLTCSLFATAAALSTASADFQLGLGAGGFMGTEYDENAAFGLEAEMGYLSQDQPINLFVGLRAGYIDGLESKYDNAFYRDHSDMDLFEGAFVTRLLFPLGFDKLKIYGEGSLGSANVSVSGNAKARARVGGREFSVRSHFDESDWVLAWGLGAGLQFDFTRNFGVRVGYNFHGFGDIQVSDADRDPGSVNGLTSSLIFKF
ncbi:MAG: outer membrane beta-barrel protein [Verrucomicrobiota bacterium]